MVDQDLDDIYAAWCLLGAGQPSPSGDFFLTSRDKLSAADLNLNPTLYLPRFLESRSLAQSLGEREGWRTERLGAIADVYSEPRFTRPYADRGVTSGPGIVRYFTGNAATQTRAENIKYLDLKKAKLKQIRDIKKLYLKRGMILITRSGTTGRVLYATAYHDGAVGTEDLNRVVIADEALRGYVYQFLLSQMGQDQLQRNVSGGIVDHIEPNHVKDVLIPIPEDRHALEAIGLAVIRGMEIQEAAHEQSSAAESSLAKLLAAGVMPAPTQVYRLSALLAEWHADPLSDTEAKLFDDALASVKNNPISMRELPE